jgi:hypothetical protein
MGAKGLITQKEYARRRRFTPQYVSKLVAKGVIVLKQGLVDAKQADQAREAQARPGRATKSKKRAAKKGGQASAKKRAATRQVKTTDEPKAPHPSPGRSTATGSLTYWRAQREESEARLKALELQRQSGELLPRAEVLEAQRRQNGNIKTRLRRWPRSVATQLERMTAAAEIEQFLVDEMDRVLRELSADPLGLQAEAAVESVQTSAEPMLPAMAMLPASETMIRQEA